MRTVFIIIGQTYGEGESILGIATQRPQANRMFKTAKTANANMEIIRRYDNVVLEEYRVGAKYLGHGQVLPPEPKKPKRAKRVNTVSAPRSIPIAPEFNRLTTAMTPAIPS